MPIFLDDQELDLEMTELGLTLQAVTQQLEPQGRVIVEVILDGLSLVGDQLVQASNQAIHDSELRLYTANPLELAVSVLQQVQQRLDEAGKAQADAAALLQRDQPGQAMNRLAEALQVWQQVQQAVLHSSQLVGMDLAGRTFEGQPMTAATDGLLAQLEELRDKIQGGDTVALADALQYEWPPTVERWQRLIGQIIQWSYDQPGGG